MLYDYVEHSCVPKNATLKECAKRRRGVAKMWAVATYTIHINMYFVCEVCGPFYLYYI